MAFEKKIDGITPSTDLNNQISNSQKKETNTNINVIPKKKKSRKILYVCLAFTLLLVFTGIALAINNSINKQLPSISSNPISKTISEKKPEVESEKNTEPQTEPRCLLPEININNIMSLINTFRTDNGQMILLQNDNLNLYIKALTEEISKTTQPPTDLAKTKTGDFWKWQDKTIAANKKIKVAKYYSMYTKSGNNSCETINHFKDNPTFKSELLNNKYDIMGVEVIDSIAAIVVAEVDKSVSNNSPNYNPINPISPLDKNNTAQKENKQKVFFMEMQIALAAYSAFTGSRVSSASNFDTGSVYFSYIGNKISSSSSTKYGSTYFSFIGEKLSSVNNIQAGSYYCSYVGDKISSCSSISLGSIFFNFIGNRLSSANNIINGVTSYYSYIGDSLSSVNSIGLGSYFIN